MHEAGRAKVNLFLHVVGRRGDGYHLLDSLAVFPEIADSLAAARDDALSLTVSGPFAAALSDEADNLVLRAARRLAAARGVATGARLSLTKNLPVASGIGGGSADAAAALRLLARLWRVTIPDGLALALGADVPVCLAQLPARMGGVVLANPSLAVATPAVFGARAAIGAGFSAAAALPAAWRDAGAMARDLTDTANDLQAAAIALCPVIADVLAALAAQPGCRLARMSGSGATCVALFDDAAAARRAASGLGRRGWWVWGGAGT